MTPRSVAIVSDLHLSARGSATPVSTRPDTRMSFPDEAFASLLGALRDRRDRADRLLLLGDSFELDDGYAESYVAGARARIAIDHVDQRLRGVAEAHPLVFEALGSWVADGGGLDVVPGNHDALLGHPAVFRQFCALVAGTVATPADVLLHPWSYYLPGTLYAEHGHRFHAINAFHDCTRPWRVDSSDPSQIVIERPVGATLRAFDARRRRGAREWTLGATELVRSTTANIYVDLGLSRGGNRSMNTSADAQPPLSQVARALSAGAGHRARGHTVRAMGSSLGRRLRAAGHATASDEYSHIHRGLDETHDLLAAAGLGVPVYATGHSHRAGVGRLRSGAIHANPGSWWTCRPDGGDTNALPFVRVSELDGVVEATLSQYS